MVLWSWLVLPLGGCVDPPVSPSTVFPDCSVPRTFPCAGPVPTGFPAIGSITLRAGGRQECRADSAQPVPFEVEIRDARPGFVMGFRTRTTAGVSSNMRIDFASFGGRSLPSSGRALFQARGTPEVPQFVETLHLILVELSTGATRADCAITVYGVTRF